MLSLIAFALFCAGMFFVRGAKFRLFGAIFIFIFLIVTLFNYALLYFSGNFLTLSFINLMILSIKDAPLLTFWQEILLICAFLVAIVLFCIIFYKKTAKFADKTSIKNAKFTTFISIFFALCAIALNPLIKSSIEIFQILNPKYHKIARLNLQKFIAKPTAFAPKKQKNIVYIYLESFSRNFTSEYPNLTPNINALENRLDFTNINQISTGASVTIKGLFASQCGLPFPFFKPLSKDEQTSSKHATDAKMKFPTQIDCASEVLRKLGYRTSFINPVRLQYQRLDELLKSRKYDETFGKDELVKFGASHFNDWGVDDDEMLDIAFKQFERLSQSGNKFLQVVLNVGMHVPNGFVSQKCQKMGLTYNNTDVNMLNATACTDYLVSEFVRKIRASKWGKNTIIAIQNDHLMPYAIANGIEEEKMVGSKMFFTILDDEIDGVKKVQNYGSSLDTFTTLLGYMGVTNRLNLGRNILKEKSIDEDNMDFIYKVAMMSIGDLDYE